MFRGFPGSSAGKESACNVGDPSSVPGSGRSPGEDIGYPLQYSWASLVAQTVKQEAQVEISEPGVLVFLLVSLRLSTSDGNELGPQYLYGLGFMGTEPHYESFSTHYKHSHTLFPQTGGKAVHFTEAVAVLPAWLLLTSPCL